MELVRHSDESQRAFVERMLMEHGEVRVYDLVYNARFDDGTKCSLTRTATHVWSLRHEDGLDIETTGGKGDLAVYVLRGMRSRPAPEPVAPEWRCASCRALPAATPVPVLGGMSQGHCPNCGKGAYFRRTAA